MTNSDPQVIARLRSREFFEQQRVVPLPDGTLGSLRWVPTEKGVAISNLACGGCHVVSKSNGTSIIGATARADVSRSKPFQPNGLGADYLECINHIVRGASPSR